MNRPNPSSLLSQVATQSLVVAGLLALLATPIAAQDSAPPQAEQEIDDNVPRFAFDLDELEATSLLTQWSDGRWELAHENTLQRAYWVRPAQRYGVIFHLEEPPAQDRLWATVWLNGATILDGPLAHRRSHNLFMPIGNMVDRDRTQVRVRLQDMRGRSYEDKRFWMVADRGQPELFINAFEIIDGRYEVPLARQGDEFRLTVDGYLTIRAEDERSGVRQLDCRWRRGDREIQLWGYPEEDGTASVRIPIAEPGDFTVTCRGTDHVGLVTDEVMVFVLFEPPEPEWLNEDDDE